MLRFPYRDLPLLDICLKSQRYLEYNFKHVLNMALEEYPKFS